MKEKGYTPKLAPETMGKINVFGSVEEIHKLCEETGCECCIDFAHVLARYKDYRFKETLELFKNLEEFHIHFSGIEYSDKGERKHIPTEKAEIKKLFSNLPTEKQCIVINESPSMIDDCIESLEIYNSLTLRPDIK